MAPRPQRAPIPTDAELEILGVLWQHGPSTVREVQAELGPGTGYTTALKLLQIMLDKGLVARDESARAHVYRAQAGEESTEERLVTHLLERAFRGSPGRLAMRALAEGKASRAELDELRALLEKLEEEE